MHPPKLNSTSMLPARASRRASAAVSIRHSKAITATNPPDPRTLTETSWLVVFNRSPNAKHTTTVDLMKDSHLDRLSRGCAKLHLTRLAV